MSQETARVWAAMVRVLNQLCACDNTENPVTAQDKTNMFSLTAAELMLTDMFKLFKNYAYIKKLRS